MKLKNYLNEHNFELIVILGPTASGKSDLAITVAKEVNGEIINADLYQMYKGMDIGTNKTISEQQCGIKHHLIDVLEPSEEYDVAKYQNEARKVIKTIMEKKKIPIVVGGSNLYLDSIIFDYNFANNNEFNQLKEEYNKLKIEDLQKLINDKKIIINNSEFNNQKRLVNILTNHDLKIKNNNNQKMYYNALLIKIDVIREELYEKINKRVDFMLEQGLIEEVKKFNQNWQSQQAIGYKEVHQYLNEEINKNEMIEKIKQKSRNYAKKQITWNKRYKNCIIVKRKEEEWNKIN